MKALSTKSIVSLAVGAFVSLSLLTVFWPQILQFLEDFLVAIGMNDSSIGVILIGGTLSLLLCVVILLYFLDKLGIYKM